MPDIVYEFIHRNIGSPLFRGNKHTFYRITKENATLAGNTRYSYINEIVNILIKQTKNTIHKHTTSERKWEIERDCYFKARYSIVFDKLLKHHN